MTHAIPPLSPVVETIGVRKRFVRGSTMTEVLCGVDLAVERGSCTLLTGPSGCGKSTLLAILGCVLSPDEGEIRIRGQSLAHLARLSGGCCAATLSGSCFSGSIF